MRKLDGAGLLEVGRLELPRAVALTTGLPIEVARLGLDALMADGTIETTTTGLLWLRFEEAQESTKSDAQKKRDNRQRARDKVALAKSSETGDSLSPAVTGGHPQSPAVTRRPPPPQPSSAQLSPPQPSPPKETSVEQARPDLPAEVFEYWRQLVQKPRAVFDKKRRKAVVARLAEGRCVEDLKQAVLGCTLTPHNLGQNDRGERYVDLELICRDGPQVERFMANALEPPRPTNGKKPSMFADADKDVEHVAGEIKW